MEFHDYLMAAIEIIDSLNLDLPQEAFGEAVAAQARLMANLTSD